jgi:DNA-binding IscR family transcriptional regulator
LLLGPKYLAAGNNIYKFLLSRFIKKIARALKRAAIVISKRGRRKGGSKR